MNGIYFVCLFFPNEKLIDYLSFWLRKLCMLEGTAEDIGRSLLAYGRRIPKQELFARLDAVDQDTIRAVADRFIYDQVHFHS